MVHNTTPAPGGAVQNAWQQYIENAKQQSDLPPGLLPRETTQRLSDIRQRFESGKRLTAGEKCFVKSVDPELHATMNRIEREGRRYQTALRQCKTKTERKQLSFAKTMYILSGNTISAKTADANNTLTRLNHMREIERQGRFSRWA